MRAGKQCTWGWAQAGLTRGLATAKATSWACALCRYPVAASADVILSPITATGAEHWHLVMQLMGGDHAGLSKALKADESGYDPEIMGLADESRRKREAAEEARQWQEGGEGEETPPSGGADI